MCVYLSMCICIVFVRVCGVCVGLYEFVCAYQKGTYFGKKSPMNTASAKPMGANHNEDSHSKRRR